MQKNIFIPQTRNGRATRIEVFLCLVELEAAVEFWAEYFYSEDVTTTIPIQMSTFD
jgi:hypothetical protein